VAEHLPYHPKVKSSSQGTAAAGTRREKCRKIAEKDVIFHESKYYLCYNFNDP